MYVTSKDNKSDNAPDIWPHAKLYLLTILFVFPSGFSIIHVVRATFSIHLKTYY